MSRAVLLACGLALALAGPASAHSLVRVEQNQLRYISADTTSLNNVTIRDTGSAYRITDPTVDGGMDAGPCTPLQVDSNGWVTEVECSKSGIATLRVDIGERDDTAKIEVSLPATVLGGPGNDTIDGTPLTDVMNGEAGNDTVVAEAGDDTVTGGDGDDSIDGGEGKDVLHGGDGADTVKAGPGDDDIRTRDTVADTLDCGEGTDTVAADELDNVPPEAACETVQRAAGTPDTGQPQETVVKADRTAPLVRLGGAIRQRARRVWLLAAASESGSLEVACTVRAGGRRYRLKRKTVAIPVDGAGVRVTFAVPARAAAAARRGGASARFTVRARDRAGNRSTSFTRTVRLR